MAKLQSTAPKASTRVNESVLGVKNASHATRTDKSTNAGLNTLRPRPTPDVHVDSDMQGIKASDTDEMKWQLSPPSLKTTSILTKTIELGTQNLPSGMSSAFPSTIFGFAVRYEAHCKLFLDQPHIASEATKGTEAVIIPWEYIPNEVKSAVDERSVHLARLPVRMEEDQ
ncbi:hypothetical protein BGX27_002203, partial [Mortierella sp. AM989]